MLAHKRVLLGQTHDHYVLNRSANTIHHFGFTFANSSLMVRRPRFSASPFFARFFSCSSDGASSPSGAKEKGCTCIIVSAALTIAATGMGHD
jgi:hypothetical protein